MLTVVADAHSNDANAEQAVSLHVGRQLEAERTILSRHSIQHDRSK